MARLLKEKTDSNPGTIMGLGDFYVELSILENEMNEKLVFLKEMPAGTALVKIIEPGHQSDIKYIQCTIEEAEEIVSQIDELVSRRREITRKPKVVIAVVRDDNDKYLIARRSADQKFGGLWEFPGGKVETGESLVNALEREVMEELSCECDILPGAYTCTEKLTDSVLLFFYRVMLRGPIHLSVHSEIMWVDSSLLCIKSGLIDKQSMCAAVKALEAL